MHQVRTGRIHKISRHSTSFFRTSTGTTTRTIETMNLRFSTLAAIAVGSSSAFVCPKVTNNNKYDGSSVSSSYRHNLADTIPNKFKTNSKSYFSLKAIVAPDLDSTTALTPSGNPLAEGSIVSIFKGGLVAVRLNDEEFSSHEDDSSSSSKDTSSLGGDLIGRQVVFAAGNVGIVVAHRPPVVYALTDINDMDKVEGTVTVLDSLATLEIPGNIKVSDCFGRSKDIADTADGSNTLMSRPIFAPIPQVKDIALINKPLITGVTMFDAVSPLGKGQNMLMIGHSIDDMRQYACKLLDIQKGSTKCVYASTTDNDRVKSMLEDAGVIDDIIFVGGTNRSVGADDDPVSSAAQATMIAATACSIAESFAIARGLDTLVVVDCIDAHKRLWDATTRVLVDVFGIDSVVKGEREGGASSEMRAYFSSLIQRSAQYKIKRGGGSVTLLLMSTIPKLADADEDTVYSQDDFTGSPDKVKERIELLVKRNVPLTEANLRKIQIPIPSGSEGVRRLALQHVDDLISMSDGQIWFDEELEISGRQPPMDFQRSVTRIGIGADTESRADAPAIRKVVEGLRMDLSQAADMDGADVATKASKKQIRNALAWFLAMHQPSSSEYRRLSESCTVLLAASGGYLGDVVDRGVHAGTPEGEKLIKNLIEHVNLKVPGIMAEIDETNDITEEKREEMKNAIESFFS